MTQPSNQVAVKPVWQPSAVDHIEQDLAAVWTDLARSGPVSRAIMSNLIVVAECSDGDRDTVAVADDAAIAAVLRRHPARAIVLSHTPGISESAGPKHAHISVLTFGAGASRYGVELVAVHAACADRSIPSIVRALTVGDVPTTVWWASDLSQAAETGTPTLLVTLAPMVRQLMYDSATWGDVGRGVRAVSGMLAGVRPPDVADLNWRRLAALRRGVVQALTTELPAASDAGAITVQYRPAFAAGAMLIGGWLKSRLQSTLAAAAAEDARETGNDLVLTWQRPHHGIRVSMNRRRVLVECETRPSFSIPVPDETDADALSSELCALSGDESLLDAIRAIAELKG